MMQVHDFRDLGVYQKALELQQHHKQQLDTNL